MNILPFLFVSTVGLRGGAQVGEHWPDVMALLCIENCLTSPRESRENKTTQPEIS